MNSQIENFPDGSFISTDNETGNQTVYGSLAHDEYFRRIREVEIMRDSPDYAVVKYCRDLDGSRKCELIRTRTTNPITAETFGPWIWCVWQSNDPLNWVRYASEEKARAAFTSAMLHGTNGFGVQPPAASAAPTQSASTK